MRNSLIIFLIIFFVSFNTQAHSILKLQEPGHFAIMRHALAPGTGDPQNFQLDDCKTQRNLSTVGRLQAQQLGKKINSIVKKEFKVYTSQWCRCLETAKLLNLGPTIELDLLNSFFQSPEKEKQSTNSLKKWLEKEFKMNTNKPPMLLVSHQVNITALLGVFPSSGEIFIVKYEPGGKLKIVDSFTSIEK